MHTALHALPVLQDNVIWIWVCEGEAVVVDPAVAPPVQTWLEDQGLTLTTILQTITTPTTSEGPPNCLFAGRRRRWWQQQAIDAGSRFRPSPSLTVIGCR